MTFSTVRRRRAASAAVLAAAMFAAACSGGETTEPEPLPDGYTVPAPTADADAAFRTGTPDIIYDQDQLHTFELHLDPVDLAFLDEQPTREEYVEGSMTFDGETLGTVGIRYKGSIGAFVDCLTGPEPFNPDGSKDCTKLSIKVDINLYDEEQEFYGLRKLQFHSMNIDPSLMRERLGYHTFREMGVPAPRSTHARLVINGRYSGVYALVEQIDGRFLREWFEDPDGNLYKEVWPFDSDGDVVSDEKIAEGLRTNEDAEWDFATFTTFAEDLLASTDPAAADALERWTDVDTLFDFLAVDRVIGNDDGPTHFYCDGEGGSCSNHNYYWYEDPTEEQLHLIAWDLDNAFENLTEPSNAVTPIADEFGDITENCAVFTYEHSWIPQRSAACDPLFAALAEQTAELERRRAEVLAGPLSRSLVEELLATWSAQIEPAVAEAAELHDDAPTVEEWRAGLDRLAADIASVHG